jgi:hypothetical protein
MQILECALDVLDVLIDQGSGIVPVFGPGLTYVTTIFLSSGTVDPSFGEMLTTSPGRVPGFSLVAATSLTLVKCRSLSALWTSLTS